MAQDSLGDRMKSFYEQRTRSYLPRRTYVIIRSDGKAFHTYTRGCHRPFDYELMADMDATAKSMCEQIQGAKLAYVQSDEISIVLTDFDTQQSDAWFDYEVQKITSISSALATAAFNRARLINEHLPVGYRDSGQSDDSARLHNAPWAHFDSRVFSIPQRQEVINYFVWRQQDAVRNSIQMAGQSYFSQIQLHGVSCDQIQEKLFQEHAVNWNDYPDGAKRGRIIVKQLQEKDVEYQDKRTGETRVVEGVQRREWVVLPAPDFTKDGSMFSAYLP